MRNRRREIIVEQKVQQYRIYQQFFDNAKLSKWCKAYNERKNQKYIIQCLPLWLKQDIHSLKLHSLTDLNKALEQQKQSSDHFLKFHDSKCTRNNQYFIYNDCNEGNLEDYIKKYGPLSEKKAIELLQQLIYIFQVFHRYKVVNKDLSPYLFFVHSGQIKFSYDVLSRFKAFMEQCGKKLAINDIDRTLIQNHQYRNLHPSIFQSQLTQFQYQYCHYSQKYYIRALGNLFYFLLFSKYPQNQQNIYSTLHSTQLPLKISITTKQFLIKLLQKQSEKMINWDQLTQNYIIKNGELINKKQLPIYHKNLNLDFRGSMRSNPKNVYEHYNSHNLQGTPNKLRISLPFGATNIGNQNFVKVNSPKGCMLSPPSHLQMNSSHHKNHHTMQISRNALLQIKKSPCKPQQQIINPRSTIDPKNPHFCISYNTSPVSSPIPNNPIKRNQNHKTYRPSRLDILIKNHSKCLQVYQLIIETNKFEQKYAHYIAYLIFRNLCKEIDGLFQNLKKQPSNDIENEEFYKQFRIIVKMELKNTQKILNNFAEILVEEQAENRILGGKMKNSGTLFDQLFQNRHLILKHYIQELRDTDEDVRLAAQIVDYLEQNILIKKYTYERMSRSHLIRELRNKISRY